MIDLDQFKRNIDSFCHDAAYQVLVLTARILAAVCDPHQVIFGRFGGEEFLAILPGFQLAEAL